MAFRFKVGDKVRTVKEFDCGGDRLFPIGTVGIIGCVEVEDALPYKVIVGDYDYGWYSEDMLEPFEGKTYEQGLADAWELAKRLVCVKEQGGLSCAEFCEVFGDAYTTDVFANNTYEEALAKVKAYEDRTKIAPNVIVEDNEGTRALVLDDCGEGVYSVLTENGCVENWHREGCVVVLDRTIDVSELVKRIGGR